MIPGSEDPLEKGIAVHSSILAWRISCTERSLVGYSPWGHKESDMTEWLTTITILFLTAAKSEIGQTVAHF